MTTGLQFVNIAPKRLLNYEDLGARFFDYFREYVRAHSAKAWAKGGVFGNVKAVLAGSGINTFRVTFTSPYDGGVDNAGHILTPVGVHNEIDETIGRIVEVPFENTPGVVYRVGYTYAAIPRGIKTNSKTGIPEFAYFLDAIGTKGAPDSVADNGNGRITFSINSVCDRYGFSHSYAGRKCLVYLNNPTKNANVEEVAIETCVISWNGTQNRITTVANFGQTLVSLVAADYTVVVLGPWVSKNSTNAGLDDMFIGRITGNGGIPSTGDNTNQNLINQSLSSLAANTYTGGPNWLDGTPNPITEVNTQISKMISDLSYIDGAKKVGANSRPAWLDGRVNLPMSIQTALETLITDLSAQATQDGAGRIGAVVGASNRLAAGTVRSQLNQLEAGAGLVINIKGKPILGAEPADLTQFGGQTFGFNGTNVVIGSDTRILQNQQDNLGLVIEDWNNVKFILWQGNATLGNFNTIYGMNHPDNPPENHCIHFINGGSSALKFILNSPATPVANDKFICTYNSVSNDYILPAGTSLLLWSSYGTQWYMYPSGKATPGGI